ncbi:MAG: hypothetical protein KGP29_07910 [Proteobacteria bacterium]|nr:hypothetical protein [Pseudomonadota bacterium]
MPYTWESFGDESHPAIALVATSNCFADQEIIELRKTKLIEKGFCVKIARFDDGLLMVEAEVAGRKKSDRLGDSISPAVSAEVGAQQIIDCINLGWNIMPFMGGESLKDKIPLIVDHFSSKPQDKKPSVTIFGMSDVTYATVLASHGICSFTSTPFTNIFLRSDEHLAAAAERLEKLMKGEEVEDFPRRIICDPSNKLADLNRTFHYPLNIGNIAHEVEGRRLLQIPSDQKWSISVEGFLQRPGNVALVNYHWLLTEFIKQHSDNPPAFIELGNIATRLDGSNGYTNLLHDEESGRILINPYNIDKILAKKGRSDLEAIKATVETLESQNLLIDRLIEDLSKVAAEHGIPLIQNTRNGHCANMDIVRGGSINVRAVDQEVRISGPKFRAVGAENLSGASVNNRQIS